MELFNIDFWQSFVSDTVATFLGVIVGIPIALWINNYQVSRTIKERKIKILQLLSTELQTNLDALQYWDRSVFNAGMLYSHLRNESWKAFSDGGELEWIKDLELLDLFAKTYFSIRSIQYLSEKYFSMSLLSNKIDGFTQEKMLELLDNKISVTREIIKRTQEEMKIELIREG